MIAILPLALLTAYSRSPSTVSASASHSPRDQIERKDIRLLIRARSAARAVEGCAVSGSAGVQAEHPAPITREDRRWSKSALLSDACDRGRGQQRARRNIEDPHRGHALAELVEEERTTVR